MPELPEVETVVRQLNKLVKKQELLEILSFDHRLQLKKKNTFISTNLDSFLRIGKFIVIKLNHLKSKENSYIAIHLRMTGRLIWFKGQKVDEDKHLRAIFHLAKGHLAFSDIRRFGTIEIHGHLNEIKIKGVDPTTDTFDLNLLSEMLKKAKQPIKTWLMRQDKLIGIGNIYASEILFDSQISPLKIASSLSDKKISVLYHSIRKILFAAIDNCGTTFSDFQDAHGLTGEYQNFLKVYGRVDEDCLNCNAKIKRVVQGGRSTFYCPKCQR